MRRTFLIEFDIESDENIEALSGEISEILSFEFDNEFISCRPWDAHDDDANPSPSSLV